VFLSNLFSKKKKEPKPIAITIIPIIQEVDFLLFSNPTTHFFQQIILKDNLKMLQIRKNHDLNPLRHEWVQ